MISLHSVKGLFSFIRYYKSKPLDDIMLVVQRKMDQSEHGKNKMKQAAVYESSLTFKLNFNVFKGVSNNIKSYNSKLSFATRQLKICLQFAAVKVHLPETCNNYDKSDFPLLPEPPPNH